MFDAIQNYASRSIMISGKYEVIHFLLINRFFTFFRSDAHSNIGIWNAGNVMATVISKDSLTCPCLSA